jgi:leader peptidase (prepilin peptidase)/N-methyltransferase
MELFAPWLLSPVGQAMAFVWGALWGSFLNVVIVRLPLGQSIVAPPSHCMSCGATIRAWDNIPILSYLVRRGRCGRCGVGYSPRYLLVELLTALLCLAVYREVVGTHVEPLAMQVARFFIYSTFVFVLVALSFIDFDTKLLPNRITYPSIPIALALGRVLPLSTWRDVDWKTALIGATAGYLVIRLLSDGYYWLTKREGLGYGDGKLLAIIGALFGWQALPWTLFSGSVLGSTIGIGAIVLTRRRAAGPPGDTSVDHRTDASGVAAAQDTAPAAPAHATPAAQDTAPGALDATPAAAASAPASLDSTPSAPHTAASTPESTTPTWTSLRHVELPFGPFLAAGALLYLFFGLPYREYLALLAMSAEAAPALLSQPPQRLFDVAP